MTFRKFGGLSLKRGERFYAKWQDPSRAYGVRPDRPTPLSAGSGKRRSEDRRGGRHRRAGILHYLLKSDTAGAPQCELHDNYLVNDRFRTRMLQIAKPADVPWEVSGSTACSTRLGDIDGVISGNPSASRRGAARAAAENIIPTSTGAARAVGIVLPQLKGRLDGIAARVPVPDGSVVDLFVEIEKSTSADNLHAEIRAAAESRRMKGILQFVEVPVVSSDIIGNAHSSIFDAGFTTVTRGRYLKCLSWCDNEWGYSNRVCDLLCLMAGWQ